MKHPVSWLVKRPCGAVINRDGRRSLDGDGWCHPQGRSGWPGLLGKGGVKYIYIICAGLLRLAEPTAVVIRQPRLPENFGSIFFFFISSGSRSAPRDRDRVVISIACYGRHVLPVPKTCPWWHRNGVPLQEQGCTTTAGGRPVENYDDVRSCMEEAKCHVSGERWRKLFKKLFCTKRVQQYSRPSGLN